MGLSRLVVVLAVTSAFVGTLAAPAIAIEVSSSEFSQLVADAPDDPAALDRLRSVDSVDGRSVDMERALADASGDELDARLESLAEGTSAAEVDAESARDSADEILSEDRFQPSTPRPLGGLIDRIASWLNVEEVFAWIADRIPGGAVVLWATIAAIVIALAMLISGRMARRRAVFEARTIGGSDRKDLDPAALERAAEDAERSDDFAAAIRLRFKAGLLRLDRIGAIEFRPSLTSRELAASLKSATFNGLADMFDEVVYGGRPAGPRDASTARSGWTRLQAEVGTR